MAGGTRWYGQFTFSLASAWKNLFFLSTMFAVSEHCGEKNRKSTALPKVKKTSGSSDCVSRINDRPCRGADVSDISQQNPVQGNVRQRGLWRPQAPAQLSCRPVVVAKPPQRADKEMPGGAPSHQTIPPERVLPQRLFQIGSNI